MKLVSNALALKVVRRINQVCDFWTRGKGDKWDDLLTAVQQKDDPAIPTDLYTPDSRENEVLRLGFTPGDIWRVSNRGLNLPDWAQTEMPSSYVVLNSVKLESETLLASARFSSLLPIWIWGCGSLKQPHCGVFLLRSGRAYIGTQQGLLENVSLLTDLYVRNNSITKSKSSGVLLNGFSPDTPINLFDTGERAPPSLMDFDGHYVKVCVLVSSCAYSYSYLQSP